MTRPPNYLERLANCMFMSLAQNIFEFAFALIFGSVGLRVGFLEIRYFIRTRRSLRWPTVPGIVQKGEILFPGWPKYIRSASFQSRCSYVYMVDGRSHFGVFVVTAEDAQSAERFQKQSDGAAVTVRYHPKNLDISLLADKEVAGRRIVQDPLWFDSW
jgi:hypothetical protein